MAAGRRESCGTPLDGEGERHHVIAVRDWQGPGSPHQVQDLRILCHECHKAKTRGARRARRTFSG
jgi:5-methylcytosine-specific restriction endonuclease McrA